MTHRPTSSLSGHVTVDLEACRVVNRKHRVDAILSLTTGVQITTVTGTGAWGQVKVRRPAINCGLAKGTTQFK